MIALVIVLSAKKIFMMNVLFVDIYIQHWLRENNFAEMKMKFQQQFQKMKYPQMKVIILQIQIFYQLKLIWEKMVQMRKY